MPPQEIDFNPVTHITADAIGAPGQRVFYIQAYQREKSLTIIVEKVQIQSLAVGVEQFLEELAQRFPDLPKASADYDDDKMRIHPPVDPIFRTGELGLGYDSDNDLVVLIARELIPEEESEREPDTVRFWCTRSQLRAMCRWGMEVAARGRPICPQCGQPMEPEGHFCPKRNGHKH
jgi:uncharacterized repeat protein (TIGR03847 family)